MLFSCCRNLTIYLLLVSCAVGFILAEESAEESAEYYDDQSTVELEFNIGEYTEKTKSLP